MHNNDGNEFSTLVLMMQNTNLYSQCRSNVMYNFPANYGRGKMAGVGGYGVVGGSTTWMLGCYFTASKFVLFFAVVLGLEQICFAVAHELGHNLGQNHASSANKDVLDPTTLMGGAFVYL
jgi:hypothetical protein